METMLQRVISDLRMYICIAIILTDQEEKLPDQEEKLPDQQKKLPDLRHMLFFDQ